jgi:hypothetical protein
MDKNAKCEPLYHFDHGVAGVSSDSDLDVKEPVKGSE